MSALPAIVNFMAESAIVFALVLLVRPMLWPELRVKLFRWAAIVALAIPLAVLVATPRFSAFSIGAGDIAERAPATAERISSAPVAASDAAPATHARLAMRPSGEEAGGLSWTFVLAVLWATGGAIGFSRYLASLHMLSRAFRRGAQAPAEWRTLLAAATATTARVELRLSRDVPAPCTFGFWRAKILVPERMALSAAAQSAVLAHELTHVRARDALWLMLGNAAAAVHWFNPLGRLAFARYREDIEAACDDAVVRGGARATDYASALIEAGRGLLAAPVVAGAAMSSRGLSARIKRLIEREDAMPKPTLFADISFGVGAAVVLMIAGTAGLVSAEPADAASMRAVAHMTMVAGEGGAMPAVAGGSHALMVAGEGGAMAAVSGNDGHMPMLASGAMDSMSGMGGTDAMSGMDNTGPDETMLYLNVARELSAGSDDLGFMCGDNARCQFTIRRGSDVTLNLGSDSPSARWHGCTPSNDGRTCRLHVGQHSVRVDVERE